MKKKLLVKVQHPNMKVEALRVSPSLAAIILRGASTGSRPYYVEVIDPETGKCIAAVDVGGKVTIGLVHPADKAILA